MGLSGLGNVIKLREMVNNQKVPLSFSSKLLSRLFARLGCSNCKKHPNKVNVLCLGALILCARHALQLGGESPLQTWQ